MTEMPYSTKSPEKRPAPKTIDALTRDRHTDPSGYQPDDNLVAADERRADAGQALARYRRTGDGRDRTRA